MCVLYGQETSSPVKHLEIEIAILFSWTWNPPPCGRDNRGRLSRSRMDMAVKAVGRSPCSDLSPQLQRCMGEQRAEFARYHIQYAVVIPYCLDSEVSVPSFDRIVTRNRGRGLRGPPLSGGWVLFLLSRETSKPHLMGADLHTAHLPLSKNKFIPIPAALRKK